MIVFPPQPPYQPMKTSPNTSLKKQIPSSMKKILIVAMLAVGAIAYPFLLLGALDISLVQTIQKQIGGPWEEYYENGQLETSGAYKNGRRHGPWKYFYEDGQLSQKGTYKKSKRDGLWEFYGSSDQLWQKATFKDGKQDGLWETYHDNGQLHWKITCKDGEKDGPWEEYYSDGRLSRKGREPENKASLSTFK